MIKLAKIWLSISGKNQLFREKMIPKINGWRPASRSTSLRNVDIFGVFFQKSTFPRTITVRISMEKVWSIISVFPCASAAIH